MIPEDHLFKSRQNVEPVIEFCDWNNYGASGGPEGVDVDTNTSKAYVANFKNDTVTIISHRIKGSYMKTQQYNPRIDSSVKCKAY